MDPRFIRVAGCHICPWSRTKITTDRPSGVFRTECGVSPSPSGDFMECPPLTPDSKIQPIPEWCPLEKGMTNE